MEQITASLAELDEAGLAAQLAAATKAEAAAQAACEAATAAVEGAQREIAGAEAGDGRDESNRSLQERLADAHNAQVRLRPAAKPNIGMQIQSISVGWLLLITKFRVAGVYNLSSVSQYLPQELAVNPKALITLPFGTGPCQYCSAVFLRDIRSSKADIFSHGARMTRTRALP